MSLEYHKKGGSISVVTQDTTSSASDSELTPLVQSPSNLNYINNDQINPILENPIFGEDIVDNAAVDMYESLNTSTNMEEENEDVKWLREERLKHRLIAWYRRPSIYMVGIFILIYACMECLCITSVLQLKIEILCHRMMYDNPGLSECDPSKLQKSIANFENVLVFTGGAVKAAVAGKLGSLSDIYGRKKILLLSLAATILGKFLDILILMPSSTIAPHPYALVFSSMVTSLGGSMFVVLALSNSYTLDCIEPNMRTQSLGIIYAFFHIGMAVGPFLGSYLINDIGFPLIQILKTSLTGFILLFVISLLLLPESRSLRARMKSRSVSDASITLRNEFRNEILHSSRFSREMHNIWEAIVALVSPLKTLWVVRKYPNGSLDLKSRNNVIVFVIVNTLVLSCSVGGGSVMMILCSFLFHWNSVQLGYLMGFVMGFRVFVLLIFSPLFQHILKKIFRYDKDYVDNIDIVIFIFALGAEFVGALIKLVSSSKSLFFFSTFFDSFGAILIPCVHSCLVKHTESDKIGELFGAIALIQNLVSLFAPMIFLSFYSLTSAYSPRLTFVLILVILSIAAFSTLFIRKPKEEDLKEFFFDENYSTSDIISGPNNDATDTGISNMNKMPRRQSNANLQRSATYNN
ncbi:hypothetical protein B5S31_g1917 [[Candida] boidinii]|nr:hypothetical protein B5S31_g1917 [[Candida] boidinii]